MEALYAKLREYLQMTEQIPYSEFADYFKRVTAEWQANYQTYNKDTLLQCEAIATVVSANAIERGGVKDANAKKFKKMAEKMTFWAQAIELRLEKEHGLKKTDIDNLISDMLADV